MPYEPADQGNQVVNDIYKCKHCGYTENKADVKTKDFIFDVCPKCYERFIRNNVSQMVKI